MNPSDDGGRMLNIINIQTVSNDAPNISYPVMGFFGNEDQNPSQEGFDNCEKALTKAGAETTFHLFQKLK